MRPMILKGHGRPVTMVKYNRDGDLLFTSAREPVPTVWRANTGERLGAYTGHTGAVNAVDVSRDSERFLTGSADNSAALWDTETGRRLHTWHYKSPVRDVAFSPDNSHVAIVTSMLMKQAPEIHVYRIGKTLDVDELNEQVQSLKGPAQTITRVGWTNGGSAIVGGCEDSTVRRWEVSSGEETHQVREHRDVVRDLKMSGDRRQFLTSSADNSAKLWDTASMTVLKTYKTERPVNAVAMSPLMKHVLLGGGQEASQVTTTSDRERFDARFFHLVYEEEFARVRGHFGPINAVTFSPDGRQFVTGGEESLVRLHNFDEEYFTRKYD